MPPLDPAFRQSAAPTSAYSRHIAASAAQKHIYNNPPPEPVRTRTERDILEEHHRFLHPATAPEDEETALARAYYEKLFKEFAVVELSRWREGLVAMRWRTADEVKQGLGEKVCGSLRCGEKEGLECREVDFKYQEKGKDERALVKVWVCNKCCGKLIRAQNGGKKEDKDRDKHRHRHSRREDDYRRSRSERRNKSQEKDDSKEDEVETTKVLRSESKDQRRRRKRRRSRSISPEEGKKDDARRHRHRHRHRSRSKE